MKREYRKRPTEQLYQWVNRLADDVSWALLEPADRCEILSEVSKQSYFEGVYATEEIHKKFRR